MNSLQQGAAFLPALDAAEAALRERLRGIAGQAIEHKRFSIALHYRRVAAADVAAVAAGVDQVLSVYPTLRKKHGKMVFFGIVLSVFGGRTAILFEQPGYPFDHES